MMRTFWTIIVLAVIVAAGTWAYQTDWGQDIDLPSAEKMAEQTGLAETGVPDIQPSAGGQEQMQTEGEMSQNKMRESKTGTSGSQEDEGSFGSY